MFNGTFIRTTRDLGKTSRNRVGNFYSGVSPYSYIMDNLSSIKITACSVPPGIFRMCPKDNRRTARSSKSFLKCGRYHNIYYPFIRLLQVLLGGGGALCLWIIEVAPLLLRKVKEMSRYKSRYEFFIKKKVFFSWIVSLYVVLLEIKSVSVISTIFIIWKWAPSLFSSKGNDSVKKNVVSISN